MKKTYLRPEIETVNVQSVEFLAQSFNEEMELEGGTETSGVAKAPESSCFWNHDTPW